MVIKCVEILEGKQGVEFALHGGWSPSAPALLGALQEPNQSKAGVFSGLLQLGHSGGTRAAKPKWALILLTGRNGSRDAP